MALALFEARQRGKAFLPICSVRIPDKPYLVQALTTLWGEGVFICSLLADPSPQVKATLFVGLGDPAMALALFEARQRGKAFLPSRGEYVPGKPYLVQPLTTLWGEGVFVCSLVGDPSPQVKVTLLVPAWDPAMALSLFEAQQCCKTFLPGCGQ
mgnify:CR=1 FL=1